MPKMNFSREDYAKCVNEDDPITDDDSSVANHLLMQLSMNIDDYKRQLHVMQSSKRFILALQELGIPIDSEQSIRHIVNGIKEKMG